MNAIIILNGTDVTNACLLSATRIAYDTSKRITTASITVMGTALNAAAARYDAAQYDVDRYSLSLRELYEVQILDGRDGVTKLFDGYIFAMTMAQSDTAQFELFYQCDLSDWAVWLDRAVCWDVSFPLTLPNSDQGIITALLGHFCPKIALVDVAQIVPSIESYDFATKTCRQVLDDMTTLSMGQWRVDFDGGLHYGLASAAPPAPFGLSTSPDYVSTFPVRVEGYKHDFTNPVNRAFVRGGADQETGVAIQASYSDPVSIGQYGEYAAGLVDTQIVTGWDAALKAKSIVLTYAYPIETGNFTIWKDGLVCGMQVHIHEDHIGIDGDYTIRALTMQWEDQETVRYEAQFGAAQPDLETILRLLNQRTLWATTNKQPSTPSAPGPPPPGSVTDASIAPGGLSASSINSVSAGTIQGLINATQIGSVSATSITGKITADQILTVNAASIAGVISADHIGGVQANLIQGAITAGQIGSVSATTIQGVVVSSQLADGIIDNLAKYATALTPIQMVRVGDPWPPAMPNKNFPPNSFFYYQPNGHFYQVNAAGTGWAINDNPQGSLMNFYYIGAISAQSIVGLIAAGQIGSITAGQITGQVQASQIAGVNASVIVGQVSADHIAGVYATAIQGTISAAQIASVNASAIQGTISAAQIANISAGQITGTLAYNQIGSINAATITIGQLQDTQIAGMSGAKLVIGSVASDKFNGYSIDVGGAGNMPGRIRVFNGAGAVVAQMGYLGEVGTSAYGGWFSLFGAGGTSYSNAPIYTDLSGNLHINNPNLNVSGQIYTSPQTFDATYSTLAMTNQSGPDQTNFVSRGLVFYYNGTKIGSLVRSPNGVYLETEFTVGGAYVLINGAAGVRSDAGYLVGSTRVINSSGQYTGPVTGQVQGSISTNQSIYTGSTLQASSGIYAGTTFVLNSSGQFVGSGINTSGTCYAGGGYSGGAFTGAGVNCPGYGIGCAGVNPQGYVGQSYTVAFHDNNGNALQLWLNGVNYGQIQLRFVGGVFVGTA